MSYRFMHRPSVAHAAVLLAACLAFLPISGEAAPAASPATQRFVIVPEQSQVVYRVQEVLFNEGNRLNVAVGMTNAVRGEIFVDLANPGQSRIGSITVDISTFRSDSARRDNFIRSRWLESARFPIAEFTPTSIQGLPAAYAQAREVALQVTGNLRVRTTTRPTTFETRIKLDGDTLTGVASALVLMTDFGFDPPSIFGILRADNEVRIEFRFVARPAG